MFEEMARFMNLFYKGSDADEMMAGMDLSPTDNLDTS